ncbi:MAG: hypothetical protein IT373_04675 [Polyangiaceae bacterium]|nr:hypothetical protein [Polyangiaceae bacterium]
MARALPNLVKWMPSAETHCPSWAAVRSWLPPLTAALFGTRMGFEVHCTNYDFRAAIWARETPRQQVHPAFLNSNLFGIKTAATPAEYVYELEYAAAP